MKGMVSASSLKWGTPSVNESPRNTRLSVGCCCALPVPVQAAMKKQEKRDKGQQTWTVVVL
jgi:hypothetical protein